MAGAGKRKVQTNKQKRNSGGIKANVYHKGTILPKLGSFSLPWAPLSSVGFSDTPDAMKWLTP